MNSRPVVLEVSVPTPTANYPVYVGTGVLDRLGSELRRVLPGCRRVAVISDSNVMPLFGARVLECLAQAGFKSVSQVVPAGEASKTPQVLLGLVGELIRAGLGRNDAVVALGGGMIGDLAGLTAALFMRGIAFVQCPTSLLAQVDASVGGKVAVDLTQGKNLLGAFHFPRFVLIDPDLLATLPDQEIGSGLGEMLKHGLLFSAQHTEELLAASTSFYERDGAVMGPLIAASMAFKAACVSRDPLETSAGPRGRAVLNLGHTLGHAIEAASEYEVGHGQAVGLGLVAAARISHRLNLSRRDLEPDIVAALQTLRLRTDLDTWLDGSRLRTVERKLLHDKKRAADMITYIALSEVGEPRTLPIRAGEILGLLRR